VIIPIRGATNCAPDPVWWISATGDFRAPDIAGFCGSRAACRRFASRRNLKLQTA
jgi:hypothetical protein